MNGRVIYFNIENLVLPTGRKLGRRLAGPAARRNKPPAADHNQMPWGIGKLECCMMTFSAIFAISVVNYYINSVFFEFIIISLQ